MATKLQEAADEIGEADGTGILGDLNLNFGLTQKHVVGDLTEIQGGIKTTTSTLSEETTKIDNILTGQYHTTWDKATTDTLIHIGSAESKPGDGSVIGGLFDLTEKMGKMVTDTEGSLQA